MAPTGKVEPQFGWHNQAAHLALTHTPLGVAAMTLAEKARGPAFARAELRYAPGDSRAANQVTSASARELQTQLARQRLVGRQMRQCIEALSQRAEDAEKRYADLEDELNVAREEILLQQNDKHSLQASLDLLANENARLTASLAENNAALEQARDRIERGKAELDAANLAHKSLSAAVEEANGKQRVADGKLDAVKLECRNLTTALDTLDRKHQIEVNNLKAVKAERNKLLAALDRANQKSQLHNQKLRALQTERDRLATALNKTNERHRADIEKLKSCIEAANSRAAIAENLVAKVRDVLLEKFALLQASVDTRNCELHDLERSRLRLIDGTRMLLEIFAMRDVALARADARIRFLTDRVAELEAQSYPTKAWPAIDAVSGMCGLVLEHDLMIDASADSADAHSDDDVMDERGASEPPSAYLASTMLAETITF